MEGEKVVGTLEVNNNMKAVYYIGSKRLVVTGSEIADFDEIIDEVGEWRTLNDKEGNPLFDCQLDFDNSIDEKNDSLNNPKNYGFQYVNLIEVPNPKFDGSDDDSPTYIEMGHDWRNCDFIVIPVPTHDPQSGERNIEYEKIVGEPNPMFSEPIEESDSDLLIDQVLFQIERDSKEGNMTAIEEMLKFVPRCYLLGYLPEEISKNFK